MADRQIYDQQVHVNGMDLYYHTAGNNLHPPIIFFHGWGSRWKSFGPYKGISGVIEELAKHFYVIAPELPGLVRSDAPKLFEGYEEFARIVHALVSSLGLSRAPYVMGTSFGGIVAAMYTKRYPQEVRHVILVNAIIGFQAATSHPKFLHWWGKLFPKLMGSVFIPKPLKKLAIRQFFGTPYGAISDESIERKTHYEDPFLYVYDTDLGRLSVPILLAYSEQDTRVPLTKISALQQQSTHIQYIKVPGKHAALYFHPERVVHTILEHLNIPKQHDSRHGRP